MHLYIVSYIYVTNWENQDTLIPEQDMYTLDWSIYLGISKTDERNIVIRTAKRIYASLCRNNTPTDPTTYTKL